MKALSVFGTRPEAIKMSPVVKALNQANDIDSIVCVTGQHREMLDPILKLFDVQPDYDLDIMRPDQTLGDITCAVLSGLEDVFNEARPDIVLVHGDTTTAVAASLAAFYARTPVGHVEAGLRTGDLHQPWPEEMNRRLIDDVAQYLFAPTEAARQVLEREGRSVQQEIYVTGNTVIDALKIIVERLKTDTSLCEQVAGDFEYLQSDKRIILVTGHRRESFGEGFRQICAALSEISRRQDVQIVYPVHLNKNVRQPVYELLEGCDNVYLTEPLEYLPFVYLMNRADFIITDSGGIQEEAPALGKPVLVTRHTTERPEAVEAGTAQLVGPNRASIVDWADRLLDCRTTYQRMSQAHNPYGDGFASQRITRTLRNEFTV